MTEFIQENENVLVRSADGIQNFCTFQTSEGTFIGSDDVNCAEKYSTSEQHEPSNFVCKKDVACSEVIECESIVDGVCNLRFEHSKATKYEAKEVCESFGGYLPRVRNADEFNMVVHFMGSEHEVWISLTSRVPE